MRGEDPPVGLPQLGHAAVHPGVVHPNLEVVEHNLDLGVNR